MKPVLLFIAGLLLFAPEAGAQVIINHAALDQLAGIAPVAPPVVSPPVIAQLPRKISYRRIAPRRIGVAPRFAGNRVVAKPAPAVAAPVIAPVHTPVHTPVPTTVQQPMQPVVARPVVARPVAPPKPQLPAPVVIDFAAGAAGLPGNVAASLKPFCAHAGIVTIDAYAAADPSDPSLAARLSMSRAFAIRDALTACGVASANIIPRANGASSKTPDLAKVSVSP